MRKPLRAICLGLILAAVFAAPSSVTLSGLIGSGYEALEDWRFQEADELAAQVSDLIGPDTDKESAATAYYFLGQYWFYHADYRRALSELDQSKSSSGKTDADFDKFYPRVQHLAELFADAQEKSSAHFVMRWVNPRDEVLVDSGLEALEQAYSALAKDFNYTPPGEKILVEILPAPSDLAQAVGLDESMIKDSGTVAVCKFRRLMVTSPRALAFGYEYQTTLSHELSHFFIFSLAGEQVPIWLHEGIAKYEESSYKNDPGRINPAPKSFLVTAIKNNELITFQQMSPTFAQFKSPKQGQLAFAEVETYVGYLKQTCGQDSWFKIFDLLKKGTGDQQAVAAVCKQPFPAVWAGWKKWVLSQGWPVIPGAVVLKLEFKEQEGKEEEEAASDEEPGKGSQYARLGDLLRDRGSYRAAVVEYNKAIAYEPYSPTILNKLGLGQLLAKDYQSAIATLNRSAQVYPEYSSTYSRLGQAYLAAADDKNAILAFETALGLNPFNPGPYNNLYGLYSKAGDKAKADTMARDLEIIKRKNK